jgi:Holliday junction resolvase RusA-like endonuclease
MKFEILIEPIPQSRPRFGRGRAYELPRMTAYKNQIRQAALVAMHGKSPTQNAVKVQLKLWRKFKVCSRSYGDIDNHVKAIFDALNKIAWLDDSQVVSCTVDKY